MTVKECYEALGADYEGTLKRLCSEKLVQRFALKFLADGSFAALQKAMEEENYEEAFRAAHTLKGVGMNLGFTKLFTVSDELTEQLRGAKKPSDDTLLGKIGEEYEKTVALLKELQESV
ncbi:MAG: Hpt domain-containing protein [Roseburia sp.]|nr:Hpt domain-containing protein [Roseburia sp.]MCM1096622.1 Hpt domain-containing protein [Ruminococcus flavefaciens]